MQSLSSKYRFDSWIVVILLAGLLSYGFSIWWGLPADSSWAADVIHPLDVIEKTKIYPYPPLHFYILRLVYVPFIWASSLGWIDLTTTSGLTLLMLLGRATSVIMALGIVFSVYLISLEISKKQLPALLSAACVLGNAPLVYYGKLMNVEVPYIFWFSLSLIFYIRAVKSDQTVDYSLFALTSMLSVCTKDQAYGLVVLPALFLGYRCFLSRHNKGLHEILIPATIGLVTFLAVHNILFDFSTFAAHFNLLGKASYTPTDFTHEPTVYYQRYRYLVLRLLRDIQFNLGWPMSIVAFMAIVSSLLRKNKRYLLLLLLLPCLSYYGLFLSLIMYSRDRFVIPICIILCIFCGHFVAEILEGFGQTYFCKLGIMAILSSVLGYSLLYANSVNALMLSDSRYFVEQWMANNIELPATVGFIEKQRNHPRFMALKIKNIPVQGVSLASLQETMEKQNFSYLIISSGYTANRFPIHTREYKGVEKLRSGTNYQLALCYKAKPLWNLLYIEEPTPAEYYDPRRKTGNFNKLNPEICIYEKRQKLASKR